MIVAGLFLALGGVGMAVNVASLAERLAELAGPLPAWVKWPLNDNPTGYRILGLTFFVLGLGFFALGLNNLPA
ncbi:MAG TPA: hypothetical protein VKE27_07765 [Candidatus Dormibacteraeota bacterium]|nr:hypothetical protein [Candidatus Dormibacteraeota bacterium]